MRADTRGRDLTSQPPGLFPSQLGSFVWKAAVHPSNYGSVNAAFPVDRWPIGTAARNATQESQISRDFRPSVTQLLVDTLRVQRSNCATVIH